MRLAAPSFSITAVMCGQAYLTSARIAESTGSLANTLSANLNILTATGLTISRREGRSIIYTANFERMRELLGFLMEDCCAGEPAICMPVSEMARQACRAC